MTPMLNLVLASPIFMIEPLPYLRSIWLIAAARAFSFSGEMDIAGAVPFCVLTRATPYVLNLYYAVRRHPTRRASRLYPLRIIARTFVLYKRIIVRVMRVYCVLRVAYWK